MSKVKARQPQLRGISGYETSLVRCAIVIVLVVVGIAWIFTYTKFGYDHAHWTKSSGLKEPKNPIPWMSDLKDWNYLIGFGLFFLGLIVAAHKSTPLGRGRGVVVGMLGCFLIGLAWVVFFYFVGADTQIPLFAELGQKNLFVGVAFMAVGFSYATKWE
ncbi:cell division protein CrgA [Nocardioides mangrovicus]|uniref:Cell division protein CrgA n=1 Tax=Nocardioides mangrovicus TaxID=2478913 RepID=A0A3L8NZ65_9ACTN|nr:cell division protein CrgA [Nocardioides mangrovicus]RLV48071.1 cell division protein CrgA [Nocardioides mangrovicus]